MPIEYRFNSGRESQSWLYFTIFGGIAAVVLLGWMIIPSLWSPKSASAAPPKPAEQVETPPPTEQATETAAQREAEDKAAISTLLDQIRDAAQRQDFDAMRASFDAEGFYAQVSKLAGADSLPESRRQTLLETFRQEAPPMFAADAMLDGSSHRLNKIDFFENGQVAVVYIMDTDGGFRDRIPMTTRWWMRKTGSQWKFWDAEPLGQWMCISTAAAMQLPANDVTRSSWQQVRNSYPHFRAVYDAIKSHDLSQCQGELTTLDAASLPPPLAALRSMYWAYEHISQSKFDDALKDCDAAERTGEDVPFAHAVRTRLYDNLGQYDNAYQSELKWESAMGGNSELYYQMGRALKRLNRPEDAAAAFGKSLDGNPDDTNSFIELCKLVPTVNESEIARRLGLCRNPTDVFALVMPALQQARDVAGLQAMLDAYRARPESARDPMIVYFTAETAMLQEQYKHAEDLLAIILPLAEQPGRENFAEEYYLAATLAGDGLQRYADASDIPRAFRDLGRAFCSTADYRDLDRLIAAHLARFSRDPWALYYRAKLFESNSDFDDADSAYRLAMSLGDAQDIITFREGWVNERYIRDEGISAYEDIPTADIVFPQLAKLFATSGDRSDLARLVSKRRSDAPHDPNLPMWEAESKFLSGKYADAVRILDNNRDAIEIEKFNIPRFRDLYIRGQVRLRHFDAARAELSSSLTDDIDWLHIAVVECAAGDANGGREALDAMVRREGDSAISRLYRDPDIGPALASPAFASWRQDHPDTPSQSPVQSATTDSGAGF
jgi:tetratricopeptide (TPR) repeat protein